MTPGCAVTGVWTKRPAPRRRIRRARLTIGNNLLVASAGEDDARVFELSPHHVAVRRPADGTLVTTNHFVHEEMAPRQNGWVVPSSVDRCSRLGALCDDHAVTPQRAAAFLRDTLSQAPDGNTWSCIENPGTIFSSVAEPASGRLWVRVNDHPKRTFVELAANWAEQRTPVKA